MDFELKGRKAIVSAGGSGIGYTIVEEFIKQGVTISTCDIDENRVQEFRDKYPQIHAEVVDVGDEQAVKEFCIKSIEFLDGLDCLVNNAGVAGPTLAIEEIDAEEDDKEEPSKEEVIEEIKEAKDEVKYASAEELAGLKAEISALTEKLEDVTAHAEMQAITAASNFLNGNPPLQTDFLRDNSHPISIL